MLHLIDIAKSFGARSLFEGLSWHVGYGERIGLVGRNGVGKTTLFRLVTGELSPDTGEVITAKRARVGYLAQEADGRFEGMSVVEAVLDAADELTRLESEKAELEASMAAAEEEEARQLLPRYERVQARYEALGGYGAEADARRILAGLGFRERDQSRPVHELSGGWGMRVSLARLLVSRPDLLLLDEPTNHLDLEALLWFEGFLASYPGSVVIISHDRWLLNRVVTHVAELTPRGIDVYTGDYDRFLAERAERRELVAAAARNQQRHIAQNERFIERFRAKNTKAKAVQSRIKALERLDRIEAPEDDDSTIRFRFPQPPRSGKDVAVAEGVAKRYGALTVYSSLDFSLQRGQRVALVGPNGAGKSTLLKLLAGEVAADSGELRLGYHVDRAYFAQHQLDVLDPGRTVLAELEAVADVDTYPMCRSLLGAFQFTGDDVTKQVQVLSGGEKARLALARMLLRPSNLLLLDEPTNHLDMQSRGMLEQALGAFDGTLVVISHDRHFINVVANEVWEVVGGEIRRFPGDFDDYQHKKRLLGEELLARGAATPTDPAAEADDDAGPRRSVRDARDRKRREAELRNAHHRRVAPAKRELAAVEERVSAVEEELAGLEARMIEPDFFDDADEMRRVYGRKAALEAEQEELLTRWEELGVHLEQEDRELSQSLTTSLTPSTSAPDQALEDT